jgi:hypothetical protein
MRERIWICRGSKGSSSRSYHQLVSSSSFSQAHSVLTPYDGLPPRLLVLSLAVALLLSSLESHCVFCRTWYVIRNAVGAFLGTLASIPITSTSTETMRVHSNIQFNLFKGNKSVKLSAEKSSAQSCHKRAIWCSQFRESWEVGISLTQFLHCTMLLLFSWALKNSASAAEKCDSFICSGQKSKQSLKQSSHDQVPGSYTIPRKKVIQQNEQRYRWVMFWDLSLLANV